MTEERRVSVLTADRMCTTCGYNLVGQVVVRERHYGMLIVRCPECAAVASVQEYPLLGRWAGRWGAILATLWFILLLGMWPATSAIVLGWTAVAAVAAEDSARPYGQYLRTLHAEQVQRDRQVAIAKRAGAGTDANADADADADADTDADADADTDARTRTRTRTRARTRTRTRTRKKRSS
jgi:hypothetical protein